MGEITITAEVVPRGPAAAFVLDDEQVARVGEGAKRFPVEATVNGHRWKTTVTRMRGEFLVGLSKAVRDAAGVQAGDTATLPLSLDTEERTVEVPPALAAALDADPAVRAPFDGLACTHRKEHARWIEEAKRDETRDRPGRSSATGGGAHRPASRWENIARSATRTVRRVLPVPAADRGVTWRR